MRCARDGHGAVEGDVTADSGCDGTADEFDESEYEFFLWFGWWEWVAGIRGLRAQGKILTAALG